MDAGQMDKKITIQQLTVAQNDFGEEIKTWTDLFYCKAMEVSLPPCERFAANRELSARTSKFYIRYTDQLTVEDRISYDSDSWDIMGLRTIQRGMVLEILAEVKK